MVGLAKFAGLWTRLTLLRVAALVAVAAALALAATWRPAIAPITPPARTAFSRAEIERGGILARIGDCAVCHTADGGRTLAGGRPLPTPFGLLYSDNLTPDLATGIGGWSFEAFRRALRDGVARDGRHLYPALPYDHFTHTTDPDLRALYAYLMSRDAVHAIAPPNRLIPPLGFRPLLAGWKLLFLHKGPVPTDPARSASWNRGAYLVESLGHCGACHTPRNLAGGEERSRAFAGGVAEGWHAPALNHDNPAARAWTEEALYGYLRTGISPQHSAAGGPMAPVVAALSTAPESDVRAIARYIASMMAGGTPRAPTRYTAIDRPQRAGQAFPRGAIVFAGGCAGCHGPGAPMMAQDRPSLGLASALRDDDPSSASQAVLRGILPPVADRGPEMPGFADSLSDRDVAHVLAYARARYTDRTPWPRLEAAVRAARKESAAP